MLKMFERQANSLGRKDVEEYIKAWQRQRLDVHNEEGALNATGDLFILLFQNGKFGDHDKSMINLAVWQSRGDLADASNNHRDSISLRHVRTVTWIESGLQSPNLKASHHSGTRPYRLRSLTKKNIKELWEMDGCDNVGDDWWPEFDQLASTGHALASWWSHKDVAGCGKIMGKVAAYERSGVSPGRFAGQAARGFGSAEVEAQQPLAQGATGSNKNIGSMAGNWAKYVAKKLWGWGKSSCFLFGLGGLKMLKLW